MNVLVIGPSDSLVAHVLREAGHYVVIATGIDAAIVAIGLMGREAPVFVYPQHFRRVQELGARVYVADDENPGSAVAVLEGGTQWTNKGTNKESEWKRI